MNLFIFKKIAKINITMKKYRLEDGVFYITNVCNLTCDHCESYNNRNFKGHFLWEDYEDKWKEWSRLVHLERINIHGGEPITNPDLINWAKNLKQLWPDASEHYVSSNGTLLSNKIDLARKVIELGWSFDVVAHDPDHYQQILNNIKEMLLIYDYNVSMVDPLTNRFEFRNKENNKLLASLEKAYHFMRKSQRLVENGVIMMHRSDPDKAYKICQSDCVPAGWFMKGGIYHCYLTSLTEEITKQFKVEEYAENLLKQFKPCFPSDSEEELDIFFNTVGKKSIKQCTLCPDIEIKFPIYPLSPKKKPL
jgi:organic radical activating enzyme